MNFEELTQYQLDLIGVNGCGAKTSILKPPYAIFFEASCNYHDVGYSRGGTEEDRFYDDVGFLNALLKDCNKVPNKIKRMWYISWSYAYFLAVRLEGWKNYTYRHERLSLEQLLDECTKRTI